MLLQTSAKFLIITLLFFIANTLNADELERWELHNNNPGQSDYLSYKLKYSGFITLFIWKELADIAFVSSTTREEFEGNSSCQIAMMLSTEDYPFTESLYPYRYQWRSKVSPDLSKVFLIEEIGIGYKEEYNVSWLNWEMNTIDFFRQRRLIVPEIDLYEEEEEYQIYSEAKEKQPKLVSYWEKDGKKPVPDYFNNLPKIENKYDFLVYENSVEFGQVTEMLDPLAILYSARWYNKQNKNNQFFNVTHKDEIREYRIEVLGEETLNIGEHEISTTKINITQRNEKEAEEEGFIIIWVSNDERRIPVKYEVEVRVGTMHVELTEKSYQQYRNSQSCLKNTLNFYSEK